MFILPLLIINIINTDKFLLFKQNIINDYLEYCKKSVIDGSYMDAPQGGRDNASHITITNNKVHSCDNKVSVPDRGNITIVNNEVITNGNTSQIIPEVASTANPSVQHTHYHIGTINVVNPGSGTNQTSVPLINDNVLPPYPVSSSSSVATGASPTGFAGNASGTSSQQSMGNNNLVLSTNNSGIIVVNSSNTNINNINFYHTTNDGLESTELDQMDKPLVEKYYDSSASPMKTLKPKKSFIHNEITQKFINLIKGKTFTVKDSNTIVLPPIVSPEVNEALLDGVSKSKSLTHFKSEGNIGRLFRLNRKIIIKSYNYPFNNENIFIVPIYVYESLIKSGNDLLKSMLNFNSNYLFVRNKLGDVILHSQINKDIQSSLLQIINSASRKGGGYDLEHLKVLTQKYYFDFEEANKLEEHNVKLNHQLGMILGEISKNKNINPDTLLQFYVLNDVNYLNSKSPHNINIDLMVSLNLSKDALSDVINIMKREPGLTQDPNLKLLTNYYDRFINHYECLFIKLNKLTLDLYHSRLENQEPFISPNELKKTRMITYYQYLFNQYN